MRRIVHISDVHFGRDREELLDPLVAEVNAIAPDLIVVSGDLTQRARHQQFRRARAFLDRFDAPWLAVPGNHDTPLDNLAVRLLWPWARYRRWIARDLEPVHEDEAVVVVGVNTVNPLGWQRGRIARKAVRRVCSAFAPTRGRRVRIVVVHHPLEHAPGERKELMRGAEAALDALADCGADIVLSGHLHSWRAEPFAKREGRTAVLQVQAGTGLSSRLRGEQNDFNLLEVEARTVTIQRYAADEGEGGFHPAERRRFQLGTAGWAAHDSGTSHR